MAFEPTGADVRDEYGIDRKQAEEMLGAYLKDNLQDSGALLAGLRLTTGRWEARVDNSKRGVSVVFLHQHGGKIVGGHASADAAGIAAEEAAYRHEVPPEADSAEQLPDQSVPYALGLDEEGEAGFHYQTLKWHQTTKHHTKPAAHQQPAGRREPTG